MIFDYRNIIKDHVGLLRWHLPKSETNVKKWEKALCRGGDFKMKMATKFCSNHFTAGYCPYICRVPTFYLRGYESSTSTLRFSPRKRKLKLSHASTPPKKRTRNVNRDGTSMNDQSTTIIPLLNYHDYETTPINSCSRTTPV